MDIYNSNGIKLEYSEVLANLPITESCEHVEELMKADHIVLSWRDSEKYTLPVGAYITYKGVNYALLEPYEPEQKSGDEFEYTPNFQHPKMYLGKVPFRFPTTDTEGNSITLLEWPYSGDIDTLLTFFCRTMESELGLTANTFNYSILGEIDMVVSTTFNAVDILSALSNIANQLKCEWHIDWDYKILYFGHIELSRDEVDETVLEVGVNVGTPSVRSSKEGFYNTYEPQGSTRNISKRAASGEYVQGDVRLALNEEDYPDKVIYTNESGTVIASLPQGVKKYVKPLIFDNIYPKLDLYVYDVRSRERYLLDENGEKIVDHYEGSTPVYKRYAVWYMRLAYPTKVDGHVTAWTDYTINPETDIISGKNLGGAFQPNNYNGAESFPLAGRGNADDGGYGFELNYHTTAETIPANPNDGDTGVIIKAGDYEIVFQQQNDYILPTTASQGIIPKGVKVNGQEVTDLNGLTNLDDGQKGNIVDLYNIVIGSAYTESAQDELANETLKYITNQFKDNNSYTLKSDVVAFKKRIDQDELLHTDSSLYIGEKVIYKNGDYELETRVMKLVTKLDYAFVQEITVGNEVLKGSTTTLKEQVQTILSGGVGNGSGGGGVDAGAVRKIVQAYANPRFLSKLNDDTAQGFITMLKGLQVGANFVPDILGEGGCLRMRDDGKVELVTDILYARMRAYFDSVVIREYKHESGNRIVSPAQGFNAARIEWIQLVEEEIEGETEGETITVTREVILEQTDDNKSLVDFFRCYWRVDDGEKKTENQFVIGDLAFCEHADVTNGSLITKRYWRVVVGRNAGNTTTEDGEAWIDLSNAHDANGAPMMTTISWEGQGGVTQTLSVKSFESSTNDIPEAHDDICMLGCVVDTTRQGAIIEYVSGTDAPTYQIYQGLGSDATNPYVLTNKNQISFGYNSSTGKAYMNVYGDAYIGDRNRNTFLEYKQNGAGGNPELNIKAKVQILPNGSTINGQSIPDYIKDNQNNYDDTKVKADIAILDATTQDLQKQIDGAIETWFMTGTPTLQNAPANEWTTDDEKDKHIGDLYYDKATGHGYRFMYDDENEVYLWTVLTDEDVTEALRIASEAQETADGKRTIYSVWGAWMKNNVNTLEVGDLFIPAANTTQGGVTYKANKVYKCTTDGSATFQSADYIDDAQAQAKIDAFVSNTYNPDKINLQSQIDGKAETFRQATDPSLDWYVEEGGEVTLDVRANHVGDLWMDISANGGKKTYIYEDNGESADPRYEWKAQEVPDEVFDEIDGKSTIFGNAIATPPTNYKKDDMWLLPAAATINGTAYKKGDVLSASQDSTTYSAAHWSKKVRYTDDSSLQNFISATYDPTIAGLTEQVDRKIESWFQSADPSTDWYDDTQTPILDVRADHVGDMWYSESTHLLKRYDSETTGEGEQAATTYFWTTIQDQKAIDAYDNAAHAQDTADGKRRVFTAQPIAADAYDVGDLWVNATYPATGTKTYENDVLRCKTAKAAGEAFNISHWQKASKYTDDTAFNGYIDAFLNGSSQSGDSFTAAAIQKAITSALGSALGSATLIDGGLMLTSLIGMRQLNDEGDPSQIGDYTTWAGISGQYVARDAADPQDPTAPWAKGHGIAAWYGGDMVDKEMLSDEEIANGWGTGEGQYRWAKSVDRFDGSGYRANGNITWNANGELAISDITSIQPSGSNKNVLNEMIQFSNAFHFNTVQGGSTILNIVPQYPFYSLYLYDTSQPNNRSHVASQKWVDDHYVTKTFFRQLFRAFKPNATAGQADVEVEPNTIDATISNIKAMVGLWTEQYISALGRGADGGGGGASVLYGLNDVTPNATGDGVMGAQDGYVLTYNGSTNHWYAAATAETYVLPQATADALGGIKIGYAASGKNYAIVLDTNGKAYVNVPWTDTTYTLPTATTSALGGVKVGYTTNDKNYAVSIDNSGNLYVNVPWTDNNTWIPWVGATENAAGTAGYMPAPTSAQRTQFLRGDGTWVSLNNYSLPLAASGVRGGVQVGYTTDDANRNYAVQLSSEKMYVNVPWQNTNTWRNILLDGTQKLGTGTDTKGLNFVGDGKTTITFLDAGTDEGQSGSADYATIKISSTWRGMQNNLTTSSSSTTDSLSAYQGYLLANGSARDNTKLPLTGGTLTGNLTINPSSGAKYIQIGTIRIGYDSDNNALKVYKVTTSNNVETEVAANFYALGAISALGQGVDGGGGGGGQGDVTWDLLAHTATDNRFIDSSYISGALASYSLTSHTHTTTIAAGASTDTSQLTLAHGTKYKLTAGGTSFVFTMPDDTNTWRNIFLDGTEKLTTAISSKGLNFVAGSNVSLSFAAAGTGSGQSGNANYGTLTISATDTTYSNATQSAAGLMSAADKKKLDGIAANANNYSLPLAANGVRGGIQIGYTTSGNNYAVQLSSEKAYVNVPWTDTTYTADNGISLSGTTFSNSGVRATTINGNYLRVNTNGTDADLTIPYATSAGSVAWANVTGKDSVLVQGSVIDTHYEGSGTITLDGTNELYAFYDRGGTCDAYEVEQSAILTNQTLTRTSTSVGVLSANVFNGIVGYNQSPVYSGEKFAVYDLALPANYPYSANFFWSFGNSGWKPAKMRILIGKYSASGFTYISKYSSDACPAYGKVDFNNSSTGFDRLRIVVSKYSRLACFGVTNYATTGLRTTYMNRCLDDAVYRNISPAKDNTWSLGTSSKRWKEVRAVNLYGELIGNASTATKATQDSDGNAINSTYLKKSGGTMTGTLNMSCDTVEMNFRTGHDSYNSKMEYMTAGNEAMVWANKNAITSFIFKCGLDLSDTSDWTGITPSLQIKNQSVYINSLITNGTSPSYNLYVNGTFYASGNSSIGGTFGVIGATTLTGLLTANGGIAIASSKTLKIGDIYLAYDSTNNAIEVYKLDGTNHVAANLYARGAISALGQGVDGGGGGGQGDVTWDLLAHTATNDRFIDSSYISGTLANYLPLSGGTMTGVLTLSRGMYGGYETNQTCGIDANNSDIINVNSILTSDISENWKESIGFKRTNGNWDTFRAADGVFYFGVNSGTEYTAVHSGNIGSQSVNYASSAGNADTLDSVHGTGFLRWQGMQDIGSGAPYQACLNILNDKTKLNDGAKLIYSSIGDEYAVLFTSRNDNLRHGTILKWGYTDKYIRIIRVTNGVAKDSDWAKIDAGYADTAGSATKATQDDDGTALKGNYLRKVSVANNTTNDFNTFESMTLTGRGDPTTGASLSHAPWSGAGPAGGYGVLTYLWSNYGIQMAWGYNSNRIYIRDKHYSSGAVWSDSWSSIALTSDIPTKVSQLTNDSGYITSSGSCAYATSAGSVAWGNVSSKPTTLSGYGITDSVYSTQVTEAQDNVTWAKGVADSHRRAFVYNTSGNEYSYLFGFSSSNTSSNHVSYGAVLKMGYADKYLRLLRVYQGTWKSEDWEKISAGYADTAGGATNDSDGNAINTTYLKKTLSAQADLANSDSGWGWFFKNNSNNNVNSTCYLCHGGGYGMHLRGYTTGASVYLLQVYNNTHEQFSVYGDGRVYIRGNVGINASSPSYKLHVDGDIYATNSFYVASEQRIQQAGGSGNFYIGNSNNSGWVRFQDICSMSGTAGDSSGWSIRISGNAIFANVTSNGAVSALSDARHKQVIRDTNLSVEQIANMPSVIFKWADGKHDNDLHVGTLAQSWQQVLPEVVLEGQDKEHTLSLSYGVAALVAAITTARKVVDHEKRITELEKENKELREEISRLKIA